MIDGFFNIAGQVATIEELNAYIAEGEAKYDEARRLGQPITGNKGSFRQRCGRFYSSGSIANADSFAALDAQEKALAADVGLNAGTRATLENSILGRRREITQNVEDAVLDELRVLNPTAEEITDIATQLRTRDVQSIIVERDNETITIPLLVPTLTLCPLLPISLMRLSRMRSVSFLILSLPQPRAWCRTSPSQNCKT